MKESNTQTLVVPLVKIYHKKIEMSNNFKFVNLNLYVILILRMEDIC